MKCFISIIPCETYRKKKSHKGGNMEETAILALYQGFICIHSVTVNTQNHTRFTFQ